MSDNSMVIGENATPTLPILKAVDSLLQDIRYNHPELPPITVVVGAAGTTRRGQVHGHFSPESWKGEGESMAHEIMLSGESLARGAVPTLGTLLHESAHAIAHARGVKDTSNNGRYHNKKFKVIAESLGIELEQADTIGWSLTTVPESTVEKYADGVADLTEALTTYRQPKLAIKAPKVRNKTKGQMDCGCEDPVTVSLQWFERHQDSLRCDDCLEEFRLIDEAA